MDDCLNSLRINLHELYGMGADAFAPEGGDDAIAPLLQYLIGRHRDDMQGIRPPENEGANPTNDKSRLNQLNTLLENAGTPANYSNEALDADFSINEIRGILQFLSSPDEDGLRRLGDSKREKRRLLAQLSADMGENTPGKRAAYLQWLREVETYARLFCTEAREAYTRGSDAPEPPTTNAYKIGAPTYGNGQNDLFSMSLHYETLPSDLAYGIGPQLGGNISAVKWRGPDCEPHAYAYTYDPMNRLTDAHYGVVGGNVGRFSVTGIDYDLNGNILSLNRSGAKDYLDGEPIGYGSMDELSYHYEGNRLVALNDEIPDAAYGNDFKDNGSDTATSGEYEYDANGNMTYDANKDITISYNHLNLPETIIFPDCRSMELCYDAQGNKLQKRVCECNDGGSGGVLRVGDDGSIPSGSKCTTTDYILGFEYKNGALEAFYHEEGRVAPLPGDEWQYEYTIKDHLGNGRAYFRAGDTNNGEDCVVVLQEAHYYPFGLSITGLSQQHEQEPANKYQYNGKELNDEFGLHWNDYGARWYDPAVARWWSTDPLAVKYPSLSSYVYVANNPLIFIDPDGRKIKIANDRTYNMLLSSLPSGVHRHIKRNRGGYIKRGSVRRALRKYGGSKNLQVLNTIVRDKRTVTLTATENSYQYTNAETGELATNNFEAPTRRNEFQYLLNSFDGTAEEKAAYAEQLKGLGFEDKVEVNGNFGATLRPADGQEPFPGGQVSTSENFEVYINPVGTTDSEQAENVGHELFGHLYFYFTGKDPRHGGTTGKLDGNQELENFIKEREDESRNNHQN